MKLVVRIVVVIVAALLLWPEVPRYRAERLLADANARLERVLRGAEPAATAVASVQAADDAARRAAEGLPPEPRPALARSIALIMTRQLDAAVAVLNDAIARGERPELTINLGRARAALGDEAGARRAYLRTAWAAPSAVGTLPQSMRQSVLDEVAALEAKLRAGELREVPAL
jgi:hypothetical protein